MRLQLRAKASVKQSREHGSSMLMFSFHLGPLEVHCMANVPREGEPDAVVYVKLTLKGRTVVDAGEKSIENWLLSDEGRSCLEGGDKERLSLGPVLLTVEGGEMGVTLRERTVIDPRFKNVEEWKAAPDKKR